MKGPHSIEEVEKAIYEQIVTSKARTGESVPGKFILFNLESENYIGDDVMEGLESLQEKGLITEDEKITEELFTAFKNE